MAYSTTEETEEEQTEGSQLKHEQDRTPLRRSPRHAKTESTKTPSPQSSKSLSQSLGAIPKATSQILTRSRSLRLSGESSASSSTNSPAQQNNACPLVDRNSSLHYHPAASEAAKASRSLLDKFDSSLLDTSNKDDQYTPEGSATTTVSLEHSSNFCCNSVDADDELSSVHTPLALWRWPDRDIPDRRMNRRVRPPRSALTNARCSASGARSGHVIVYSPGVFNGRERLDIVRRLHDMNATHILDSIWSMLSAEDLGRALQVNNGNCW